MIRKTKEKVRNYMSKVKLNAKNAVFIVLGAIGLTLLIAGVTEALHAYTAFAKIIAGIFLLLIVGYLGYGILGKKKYSRKY